MSFPFASALVTGGAGFIGSHLVDALIDQGCRVTVLDNLSAGKISNLSTARAGIEFIEGDIRNSKTVLEACKNCEAVFHLAAMVSVPQTMADPLQSTAINIQGTANVLEAARRRKSKVVVLASSCAVYGDEPSLPKTEHMPPLPLSPYALQKLTAERYLSLYHKIYDLPAVSLRFFNVYGPRQDPSSPYSGVISIFMKQALAETPPIIYGDGEQSRDFIYVADVVRAFFLAAGTAEAAGRVFNIGCGSSVTISRLWNKIALLSGSRMVAEHGDARAGDILDSLADIDLARRLLQFEPVTQLDHGLNQTLDWYRRDAGLI